MKLIGEASNQGDAPSARPRFIESGVNLSCGRLGKIESRAVVPKRQAKAILKRFERDDDRQARLPAVTEGVDKDLLGAKLRAKTLPFSRAERLGFGLDPGDRVRNIVACDAKAGAPCLFRAYQGVAASSESAPMRSAIDSEMIAAKER